MKNIGYLLLLLYLIFSGVDRINFGGNSIESFKLLPHIPISIFIIGFIFLFKFRDIEFSWIYNKKSFLLALCSLIFFILLSIILSIDIFYSAKRLVLLFIILFTIIMILSVFEIKDIKKYFYHASIYGSFLFYLFNIMLFMNWLGVFEINSNIIDIKPDVISFFIPRLGGFSEDVNRGICILVMYTFVLLVSSKKNKLKYIVMFINIFFIFASVSRTAIVFFLITLIIYLVRLSSFKHMLSILFITTSSIVSLVYIIDYYSDNEIIDVESALEERMTLNDVSHNTSTGIHFKLIKDGFHLATSDLKIFLFGSGYGTSYKIIKGYGMSGKKVGNFHSQYLSFWVETGIFTLVSLLFLTIIIPLFSSRNTFFPLIVGLFFFNQLYQLTNEPLYWFMILYYYKYSNTEIDYV